MFTVLARKHFLYSLKSKKNSCEFRRELLDLQIEILQESGYYLIENGWRSVSTMDKTVKHILEQIVSRKRLGEESFMENIE